METLVIASMESPIGELTLVASVRGLFYVFLPVNGRVMTDALLKTAFPGVRIVRDEARLAGPIRQIREYFSGKRKAFSVGLDLQGTEFQKKVWKALVEVPYGDTESYSGIARRIRRPGAARAVGAACGANPIPILIPCHRIVGRDGSLTGFAGGLRMKEKLLELENRPDPDRRA
jgi:O-6-methylguanine DNA methyltransferase